MSFGKEAHDLEGALPSTRIQIPTNQYTLPQFTPTNPTLPPPMSASKPRTSHVDNDSDGEILGFQDNTPSAPRKASKPAGQPSGTYGVPMSPPVAPENVPTTNTPER